ncbi:hypothetical protein M2T33_09255 [Klebsiella pneumoniae]|uniref:hypothetical protein n=1 Tax=Klebsiella pneumoniae TaxID=573 RepID=UPI00200D38DF|nr:hypothetical protein [Klebsiella pneumoniae]MCL0109805.1 hypothetical protein [Klebsiella pneumoniae]MCL0156514.1 hypothetical protein [Klebsiella pneumoniae]MCL0174920.1 hypothetical protein [Klebsiella pneumoniae]MCL0192132.1 hypothetical protein [Klebsiella pneumoniae]MCL0263386.1 hypothetical protein [Klebsiella pneumoniae]
MAEVPLPTPTDNPVPSTDIRDAVYAGAMLDKVVTSTELTYTDRLGGEHYTVDGIKAEGDKAVEETRKHLIPLSRQYMTLAAAQADIANIPDGSATYVRSADGSSLADEYINNAGTLEATGRKMPSQEAVDALRSLITQEVAKIMVSGAAQTASIYPDIAELNLDEVGRATYRRLSDGTSQFPALMIGSGIEFVQMAGGGFICQLRDTHEEIFKVSASGSIIRGTVTSWITDDESISDYVEIHMDGQGRIYRRVLADGTVEQVGDDGPTDDTSSYPMVASVDGNIIAVQDDTVTQITNDTGVSNISPVAYADFLRYLSNISGNYLTYRSTYDGKFKLRQGLKRLIHVMITGQSLAEGGAYNSPGPVTTAAQADYGIVCFLTGSNVDFNSQTLDPELLKSVIPCRENVGVHPSNETPGSGIGWQIHERTGHTVLISNAGASGTAIAGISAGTPAFDGATKMIQAAVAMADELGMEYVPVMVLIHGNANAAIGTSVASYRTAMENLRLQYQSVINNASGGEYSLPMFLGQLSNVMPYGGTAGTTKSNTIGIAQYQEARDNEFIHLASAQYARPYSDGEHLTSIGYRTEGEVIGSVIGGWINDNSKSSLVPVESGVVQSGNTITIPVNGCVGDLVIDTSRVTDPGNYGFLLEGATISSVAVSGSGASAQIVITKTDSTLATRVSYAETGIAGQGPGAVNGSRGCIRDSQPGTSLSGLPLYNDLAVFAFQL